MAPVEGNRNLYVVDAAGRRLDHFDVTGAARYGRFVSQEAGTPVGSLVFPRSASGATVFTFHDDDQHLKIPNVRLDAAARTTPKQSAAVLGGIRGAQEVEIGDHWVGLGTPSSSQWVLRRQGDRVDGAAAIPLAAFESFLATLIESPLLSAPYVPHFGHTDDYPTVSIRLTGPSGTVRFFTESQGRGHVPWAVEVGGTTYVVPTDAPARALSVLEPFLPRRDRGRNAEGAPSAPSPPAAGPHDDALRLAAQRGNVDEVRRLLAAGAAVNARSAYDGLTPLVAAVLNRRLAVVKVLMAAGADPGIYTALTDAYALAASAGADDILAALIEGRRGYGVAPGAEALLLAASQGLVPALRAAIAAGARVDMPVQGVQTALEIAALNGHVEAVRVLLEAGARAGRADALGGAARNGYPDIVRTLLAAGTDVNDGGRHRWPPIMLTLVPDTLRLLLEAGANVHAVDAAGRTPLLLLATSRTGRSCCGRGAVAAAPEDLVEAARLLIRAGASVKARDREGRTPLLLATGTEYGRPNTALIKLLLDEGAEVDARDAAGRTALLYAATAFKPVYGEQRNPLTWDVGAVRVLLAAGADPRVVDGKGNRILDLVRAESDPSIREIETVLAAATAPPTSR
jgi:ankyrin repeat protein